MSQIHKGTNLSIKSRCEMETAFGTLKNHIQFAKLFIILSVSVPVTTCHCRKALKKRNVIGLNLHLPTPLVTHSIPQPPNPCFCSREQKPFLSITLSVVSSRSAKLSHNVYDPTTNRNCFKTIGHIANHLHLCSNLNVPRGSLHLTLNSNRIKESCI